MNKHILILSFLIVSTLVFSQKQQIALSLQDVLRLAKTQSLQSFLAKNTYQASYWEYKNFLADYRPMIILNTQLISYANANQLRYNSDTQTEDYIRTETLNSTAFLKLRQNVAWTGGSFYIQSDLERNQNFGESPYIQFSSRPFKIGYQQNLFGYNQFKWSKKLEPKKFEKAMKEYLDNVEKINEEGCVYFFNMAIAKIKFNMANYNRATTDTLLQIANNRFKIGTIKMHELLELKLNKNNSDIRLEEARMQLRKAREALLIFLRLSLDLKIELILPNINKLNISEQKALHLAKERNVKILNEELKLIEAKRQVAETKAKNYFQANIDISYGINNVDGYYDHINDNPINGKIENVYQPEFDNYQQLEVSISIPILDWGKRKGNYQLAKSRQEITRISNEQIISSFEQRVVTKVMEFNLQYNKVLTAAKSDSLALQSYELTTLRFKKGNIDVLKLITSQNAKDNARLQYISSLFQYWSDYFAIRKMTLYDFVNNKEINRIDHSSFFNNK